MSDYSENLDFSPTRQAKIAACEKLRDSHWYLSPSPLLDESLASSPSHRNSFSEIYRMSTQAMAMKKEEMVSELKTLPPCTRTDCNEHKIPTTLVVIHNYKRGDELFAIGYFCVSLEKQMVIDSKM
ncbi:hypothetical protein TNIN_48131 [Trichonephila inaurata madagascariensis]|uniref:Uncharacterized protein n=1 Tax=Trichonephila inaurata madagascariensis TaxID=2747483 RepID=A0A8X6XXC6_9ARAC|nr:hypothetical protein TNIN_48131 [Trichonephila inaurata madagascariensis]